MLSSQGADCIVNQQGAYRVAVSEMAYGAGRSSPVEAIVFDMRVPDKL